MIEEFDPKSIEEEGVRQVVIGLMNVVDKQNGTIAEQAAELQRRRDEINRLKGEQGKPKIKANTSATDLSSEKERRQSKPHHKSSKQDTIPIDREVVLKVDQQDLQSSKGMWTWWCKIWRYSRTMCSSAKKNTTRPGRSGRIWPRFRQATTASLGQR